ncbi:hypothetical protein MLD38_032915 [Melastoma candidum]|uniref:Uncharacterized protein n=1 Tax=Melastoma candidum TaxID=119954 RepID=A0ACB9M5M8_9MYRT|nr:hypothetical protein MLD38_032915 [Melastoma candidum]
MENNFILAAAGIQPQSMPDMQSWQCPPPDPMFHPNGWDSPAFNATVPSPPGSDPRYVCNDSALIRELVGKLGVFGGDPEEIAGSSCYSTPLGSPPNFGPKTNLAEFAADPGFVERAAKFSCFGSRSFNGRSGGVEFPRGQFAAARDVKLGRVSSSPSLNGLGVGPRLGIIEVGGSLRPLERIDSMELPEEESSVIEPVPSLETGTRGSGESNPRKRKGAANRGKANAAKGTGNSSAKRCKSDEGEDGMKKEGNVVDEEAGEKKNKDEGKQPEPPKDYIHVRARRGQATDSHSLAERVRREKISERMKLLQDLVPGCNKVTGKALMLDEIINYVQSLQRQVEFLSMKLASVNTSLDLADSLMSKDHRHHHMYTPPQMYEGEAPPPPPSSSNDLHRLNPHRQLDSHFAPPSDLQYGGGGGVGYSGGGGGDDLHTIVQMGLGQSSLQHTTTTTTSSSFDPQLFHY